MMSNSDPLPSLNPLSCGRLTIDLDALKNNWRFLHAKVNETDAHDVCECAAVIKANAYGLSLENSAKTLFDTGCRNFFVATLEEGIELRSYLENAVIYILNGLLCDQSISYINNNLYPILNNLDEVMEWSEKGQGHPAGLHVDTGMNRLGLREEDAKELAGNTALINTLNLSLIMSHLACGDTPRSLMNGCQLRGFEKIADLYPGVRRSLANSAGIFNGSSFHMDLVRPGIALYGGAALKDHIDNNPMKPVVKVEACILQLREVKRHESIGYGASEVVDSDRLIATVGCGYGDGYLRHAGSSTDAKGAYGFIKGHKVPLVGRVSMDLLTVDVTDVGDVKRGDYVEVFGPNVSISQLATIAETIDYEFLTGLGHRYERIYGPLGDKNG